MALPKPTIVIFDMDGTTVRHVNPKMLHILEKLDNVSFKIANFFRWVFRRKAKGVIVPEYYSPPSKRNPKMLVHRAIHKFRRKPVDQIVEPRPGVRQVLQFLQKNNIPLAVVSNGLGKGYGDDILATFRLKKYFKAEIFREDINKSKPNPEPILLGLERLSDAVDLTITKDDIVWYVGDRRKDVIAALNADKVSVAKIVPIAVAFNASVAILEQAQNPEHIMMSYYDMLERLSEMFGEMPLPVADFEDDETESDDKIDGTPVRKVVDLNEY